MAHVKCLLSRELKFMELNKISLITVLSFSVDYSTLFVNWAEIKVEEDKFLFLSVNRLEVYYTVLKIVYTQDAGSLLS